MENKFNRFKIWVEDYGRRPNLCPSGKIRHNICIFGVRSLPFFSDKPAGRYLFLNKFLWDFEPMAWDCALSFYYRKVKQEQRSKLTALKNYPFLENNSQLKFFGVNNNA